MPGTCYLNQPILGQMKRNHVVYYFLHWDLHLFSSAYQLMDLLGENAAKLLSSLDDLPVGSICHTCRMRSYYVVSGTKLLYSICTGYMDIRYRYERSFVNKIVHFWEHADQRIKSL
uniref:Uncharacterized protein n=2 Tax=Nicotiana TaxID=4085 RepID=A0A1S4C881_TOBAC|nr:PREDICTED: uncharacterized protein LOC104247812 [Nicotiana sylvestris]XP_016497340.1 PREDICTED: uncharacterized protein LOC107816166 [Nicotiana tabacum]